MGKRGAREGERDDEQLADILERHREGLLRLHAFAFLLSDLLEGRRKQERGKEEKEGEVVREGEDRERQSKGEEEKGREREILKLRLNTRSRQDYEQVTSFLQTKIFLSATQRCNSEKSV